MLFQVRNARDDSKGLSNISRPKGMLLLRYQRQRQGQDEEGHRLPSTQQLRRKINDHELKNESRRAATRSTLICIFVCGSLLLSLGIIILVAGLLAPENHDNTPWLVIGPTCIVLGILVLLLSVEIIIKLRKISANSGLDDSESPVPEKKGSRKSWDRDSDTDSVQAKRVVQKGKPVAVHPSSLVQSLNAAALSGNVAHK